MKQTIGFKGSRSVGVVVVKLASNCAKPGPTPPSALRATAAAISTSVLCSHAFGYNLLARSNHDHIARARLV
jgi:hypothetical protein